MTEHQWAGGCGNAPGSPLDALPYREIWAGDFEFLAAGGDRPVPVCMVAKELRSGRLFRLRQGELRRLHRAPFETGPDALFVAFFASAEFGCFEALGWRHPQRTLDLFCEFRAATNGTQPAHGRSLLGALLHYRLSAMGAEEKTGMRELVMSGGPWSDDETTAILDYCEEDVLALERLLPVMVPEFTRSSQRLGWALVRGRYMSAVARMEWNGVPIDIENLTRLRENWRTIKEGLINEIDRDYGVYEGGSFRVSRFESYLASAGIPWPRLESGALQLDDDTLGLSGISCARP